MQKLRIDRFAAVAGTLVLSAAVIAYACTTKSASLVGRVSTVAAVNAPEKPHDLPLDVRGTAFQEAVWRELSRIPPGESLSYAALAARAGRPKAVRAAGTACGANNVAVLIPCHRARRGDGSPGGYAYGLERKARLLEREGWVAE